jgi:A/G-specific adenine glycosylase
VPPTLDGRARSRLRRRVLDWYERTGRSLAFRATSDPWAILVSEVMAQQTQAARAAEAWTGFMAAYPTPAALAAASPAEVLRSWRGLGYNRRALALQRAAGVIEAEHGGQVPAEVAVLERLPGIGPYSARAVAALAFGRRVGAVDTNVRRVLGRAFFDQPPAAAPLQALADSMVPPRRPGVWTHALMDIGATLCRTRNPRCPACPVQSVCAYAAGASAAGASAAGASAAGAPREPEGRGRSSRDGAPPTLGFRTTSRWLRGRILDRLRDIEDGSWLAFTDSIGDHGVDAIRAALAGMARDGLVEVRAGSEAEARLPAG